jgi:HK97 family phage major capsid protein/HK97 family phage prohead protease
MSTPKIPATLAQHLTKGRSERAVQVERAMVDEDARTVSLAFASETPVDRGWGVEVLEVSAAAMRVRRLSQGANLLVDHDWRDVIGVVESVEIGADRVARAVVRFGKSARAEEVWQDVKDGIRRNVSVGYMIHRAKTVGEADGKETYRIVDWEPLEVSLVSVPADVEVGVGRSLDDAQAAQPGPADEPEQGDTVERSEPASAPLAADPQPTDTAAQPATEPQNMSDIQPQAARNDAAEISKAARHLPGGAEMAMDAIQRGLTLEQFQREALEKLSNKPLPSADIGMSPAEVRRFSIVRALNALANPQDAAAQRAAAFEREASDAVAAKAGRAARGFYVPHDVQKRDLTVSTATAGGNLVATELSGDFIELLRNAMVVMGMGTRMLSGLQGNIAIPKMTGAGTAYWVSENTVPGGEANQSFGQVTMSPRTVGAYTDISRRLLLQSSVDVEAMVTQDLATILGLAIQQAAINGTGSANQPIGILNAITASVVGGTDGAAPTWAHIVELETDVAVANADVGTLGYLVNAQTRGKLKGTSKVSGQNGFIWDGGDTPLNGYRTGVTNAVPSNLVKGGSGAVCSAIVFGNWADLVIGMWGTLDLMADPYTGSAAGTVRIRALQDVDVAIRHSESFATMVDAKSA